MKKKTIAIVAGATALLLTTGSLATIYANAATKVSAYEVAKGEMSQIIELNGVTASNTTENYFADANLKIDKIYFKVGDTVKKGDLLISFDEKEIDDAIELAKLDAQAKEGSFSNSVQTSDKYSALYNEATRNLNVLNKQISDTEEAIINKQKEIKDRSSKLANEGAKLQVSIIDWSDRPDSDEYANLQKLAQNNAYVQSYDEELLRLQEELTRLNTQLADFKEYKAEMTSQKASSFPGVMTEGAKSELEATKAAFEFSNEKEIAKLEEAKNGIRAEFDGVITALNVSEGGYVTTGMQLASVDSLEDVIVKCNVNKYDIMSLEEGQSAEFIFMNNPCEGKITRIERTTEAGTQSAGVGVDISVDNVENYILGIEVKARINTANVSDVTYVPNEAVISEDEKSYVFVAKDNKAVKTEVTTGIKNDDYTEVQSGLAGGETIVWNDAKELKGGEDVRY